MITRCTACEEQIDPKWPFCPYCGADNRAPIQQEKVGSHRHQFLDGEHYCVLCGDGRNGLNRAKRHLWSLTSLFVSLVLGFCSLNVYLVGQGKGALASGWIRSWYYHQVTHRRRRYGGSYTTDLGHDVAMYLLFGAVGLLFVSLFIAAKYVSEDRAYWKYEDDKPWYKRRNWPYW